MIFDDKIIAMHHKKVDKNSINNSPLYQRICDEIFDRVTMLHNIKAKTFFNHTLYDDYISQKIQRHFGCTKSENNADIIISPCYLHMKNNIFQELKNTHDNIMSDNSIIIGNVFGGQTLKNLQQTFLEIESKTKNIYPHISPMIHVKDMAKIMQLLGFQDIVVVSDNISVKYKSCHSLMQSLQKLGQNNPLIRQHKGLYGSKKMKDVWDLFEKKHNNTTTFEVVFFFGSKKSRPTHLQPLEL